MPGFIGVKKNPRMKIMTVNIPQTMIDRIDLMKDHCIVPSRSEYIRMAVWEKMSRDAELMKIVLEEDLEPIPLEVAGLCEYQTHFVIEDRVWHKQ